MQEFRSDNAIADHEPLDGDETEELAEALKIQLDYLEGNCTREEMIKAEKELG